MVTILPFCFFVYMFRFYFLNQITEKTGHSLWFRFYFALFASGLNIYFWLSFIPAIVSTYRLKPEICSRKKRWKWDNVLRIYFKCSKLVMLVGTKLQHVVSSLALEIEEQTGPPTGAQVKPRDDLFWFGKPDILLRLIQFIIFQVRPYALHIMSCVWFGLVSISGFIPRFLFMQNAFEMATFLWSLVSFMF